jgi:MFS family permease
LVLSGISLLLLAGVMLMITHASSIYLLIGMTLLFGFTNGLSSFANQAALYLQAPAEDIAVAAGLYRTSAYVGAIFSSSLIGITFGKAATDGGLHWLAWILGAIGVIVVLLALLDRKLPVVGK